MPRACGAPANAVKSTAIASARALNVPPGSRVASSTQGHTTAAHGMVKSHAVDVFPATPQRTAEKAAYEPPAPSTEGHRDRVHRRDREAVGRIAQRIASDR